MRTLFGGLEEAFHFFGGVPREILFDQMRSVVVADHRERGGPLVENLEFLRFAHHWAFRPRACRPYRARTKGKVERPIRYVRESFVYGRSFAGDGDLNDQASAGCGASPMSGSTAPPVSDRSSASSAGSALTWGLWPGGRTGPWSYRPRPGRTRAERGNWAACPRSPWSDGPSRCTAGWREVDDEDESSLPSRPDPRHAGRSQDARGAGGPGCDPGRRRRRPDQLARGDREPPRRPDHPAQQPAPAGRHAILPTARGEYPPGLRLLLPALDQARADREPPRARLRRAPGERRLPRPTRCGEDPPGDQPGDRRRPARPPRLLRHPAI